MAYEQAYRDGATAVNVEGKVREIKRKTYKSHRTADRVGARVVAGRAERKAAVKALAQERWEAAAAGVTTSIVPTKEQAQWPAERRLMLDTTDGSVHRIVHVGWHDEQRCVVAWFYPMSDARTPMPKVGGTKLDQDECEYCNMADAVQMINDFNEAEISDTLPFEV